MNIALMLKRLAVTIAVLSFAVGCASTPEPEAEMTDSATAETSTEATSSSADTSAMDSSNGSDATAMNGSSGMNGSDGMNGNGGMNGSYDGQVTSYTVESGDNLWDISAKEEI